MYKISHFLAACAAGVLATISMTGTVRAETVITNGYLSGNTVWDATGSPYILEDTVTVPAGRSLMIGPGVSVIAEPSIQGYPAFDVEGNLSIDGIGASRGEPSRITLTGTGGISVQGGSTTISYTDISFTDGISVFNGYADISHSSISDASLGIHVQKGVVHVTDSLLNNNGYGIFVDRTPIGVFQVRRDDQLYGKGGIGNALDIAPTTSSITMTGSVIVNSGQAAIRNNDTETVMATDNWWGTRDGPMATSTNSVIGPVTYAPWRIDDISMDAKPVCCSSLLFISGLEGTRLYKPLSFPLNMTFMTNQLWEPNVNADVTKLYLNTTGSSTDSSIYSGDPIGSAYGVKDVYGKFMNFLDSLVSRNVVKEWKAFGYDWRKPIDGVVAGAEKRATTTESLVQTVIDLAARSRTGKVSIIAHSNGGLIAKYLVKTLTDMGKSSLVDSVISVAVPYLGTPEAIAGLLHGDDQSILNGLITTQAVARGLGKNMPSAYSLLPSEQYFSKLLMPTIVFASTTDRKIGNGSYPAQIRNNEDQTSFILDTLSKRVAATFYDLQSPIKGNATLMTAANIIHDVLDPFTWPASIVRYAIVGWNELQGGTTKQVAYADKGHTDVKTAMGDGTVVAQSAAYDAGTVASADLAELSSQEKTRIEHSDILGASSTQKTIEGMITHASSTGQFPLPRGMSWGEPDYSKPEPSIFTLSTHSPVELHVYDSQGRHTGVTSQPPGMNEEIEPGFMTFYETNIPGSGFRVQGDGTDRETFIRLPDTGEKYTVEIRGTGVGTFTYEVERDRGSMIHANTILGYAEYAGIPVTPLTVATTTLEFEPVGLDATTTSGFIEMTKPISVDIDGDGSPDFQATSTATHVIGDVVISGKRCQWLKRIMPPAISGQQKGKDLVKRLEKYMELCSKRGLRIRSDEHEELGNSETADGPSPEYLKIIDTPHDHMKRSDLSGDKQNRFLDDMDKFISRLE